MEPGWAPGRAVDGAEITDPLAMPMLRLGKERHPVADWRTIEEVALIVDLATIVPG